MSDKTPSSSTPDSDDLTTLFSTRRPPRKTGLAPLSLLEMPAPGHLQISSWLMRRKDASLAELQEAMAAYSFDVVEVLDALREDGRVYASLVKGEIRYRIQLRQRTAEERTGQLWSRIDQDKVRFLREMPLFRGLTAVEVADIAEQMDLRRYSRNDVILWEGQLSDNLYLVKSGVVGISLFSGDMQQMQTLDYAQAGGILGEYNLLSAQDRPATATATAVSGVEMLVISHAKFKDIMTQHPSVVLEMSNLLVERLINRNPKRGAGTRQLCLVLSMGNGAGRTALGLAFAHLLSSDQPTVYTEYPSVYSLMQLLDEAAVPQPTAVWPTALHPLGFPIVNLQTTAATHIPASLHITLTLEQLYEQYANVVISLNAQKNEVLTYLLQQAEQVLLVLTPDSWENGLAFAAEIRPYLHPERAMVHVILNRTRPEQMDSPVPKEADFVVPYVPEVSLANPTAAEPLRQAMANLVDRLGRTNQISVYIPTTINVQEAIDTTPFVNQALSFLGERFGGATSRQAQGVWNSEEVGLVGETVYIVRSYATKTALAQHLDSVINFVEELKVALAQEAMAVEVNQRLMLV